MAREELNAVSRDVMMSCTGHAEGGAEVYQDTKNSGDNLQDGNVVCSNVLKHLLLVRCHVRVAAALSLLLLKL